MPVKCSICFKFFRMIVALIPSKCLTKNGRIRGHQICKECWFTKFAKEDEDHSCPGCFKNLPLNGEVNKLDVVIDLTADD